MMQRCRCCNVEMVKAWSGRKDTKGRRIYLDDNRNTWNGLQCYPCKKAQLKVKNRLKDPNFAHYAENVTHFDPDPMTTRKCRVCDKFLPSSRYFNHKSCVDQQTAIHAPVDWEVSLIWGKNYRHG